MILTTAKDILVYLVWNVKGMEDDWIFRGSLVGSVIVSYLKEDLDSVVRFSCCIKANAMVSDGTL